MKKYRKETKKMAKRKTDESKKDFKEFEYEGELFTYAGRIYVDKKREAGKLTIYPMSLTLNGVLTIKSCSFYQTKNNMWVGGPQYKTGDEYKDYLYIDKSINEEMDALAEEIDKAING